MFHISGHVNRPQHSSEGETKFHQKHQKYSSKVNIFTALSRRKVYGIFLFVENTTTIYMLQQLYEDVEDPVIQIISAIWGLCLRHLPVFNELKRWLLHTVWDVTDACTSY